MNAEKEWDRELEENFKAERHDLNIEVHALKTHSNEVAKIKNEIAEGHHLTIDKKDHLHYLLGTAEKRQSICWLITQEKYDVLHAALENCE